VHLNARNNLPYADHLTKLDDYLLTQTISFDKTRAAYILALVPYFFNHYSKALVKAIFIVFRECLQAMSSSMILECVKKVYQNNSKYAVRFAEDLKTFVMKISLQNDPERAVGFVPLLFKIIKYCSVLKVEY
jgi:hypothetical protein